MGKIDKLVKDLTEEQGQFPSFGDVMLAILASDPDKKPKS